MGTIGENLRDFFKKKGISQIALAQQLKVSQQYINAIFSDKTQFGKAQAERFEKLFGISKSYLLTGVGKMMLSEEGTDNKQKDDFTDMESNGIIINLLPISAQGGTLNDFTRSVQEYECEKIISPVKDVDVAMTISGESMYPEYPSGAVILVKKINEKAFIEWGKTYVLDTCNGIIVKELHKSTNTSEVICSSLNPLPQYQDFIVNLKDVHGIYNVEI